MNSPFTPKKHSCMKEGVTRQQLMDTLQQVKLLKSRTSIQIKDYEKTIEEQNEKVCYLQEKLNKGEKEMEQMRKEMERRDRQMEEQIQRWEDEMVELKEQVRIRQQTQHKLNSDIDRMKLQLQQSEQFAQNTKQQLNEKKQQLQSLSDILRLNLDCEMECLSMFRESGGIRPYLEQIRECKLQHLQQKHQLNENIRRLQYQLQKTHNQRHFDDKVIAIRTKQVENLGENIQVLRQSLQTIQSKNTSLEREIMKRNDKIQELEEEIKEMESRLEISVGKRQQAELDSEQLKKNVSILENQLMEMVKVNQMASRRESYDELVESTIDQAEQCRLLNAKLCQFNQYKQQYYRNVDKIQYLCELLDN